MALEGMVNFGKLLQVGLSQLELVEVGRLPEVLAAMAGQLLLERLALR